MFTVRYMQENKKHIRTPLIIALVTVLLAGAVCTAINITSQIRRSRELAWEEELANLTWEQLAADPERYGASPIGYDDFYFGQSEGGVCTHDETFTEPVIPDGKYYPDGNVNAEYYLEISGNTMCYKDRNGEPYGNNQYWIGQREYKVITVHHDDIAVLCPNWRDAEFLPGSPYLDKYQIINGTQVDFDENGRAYIAPICLTFSGDKNERFECDRLYIPE